MTQAAPEKPYIVVVGVDYSPTGEQALFKAFELASLEPRGEVHVVNVVRTYGTNVYLEWGGALTTLSIEEAADRLRDYVQSKLEEFRSLQAGRGRRSFARAVTHIRLDAPAEEIAQLASDLEADLVVVGTHGRRGFRRVLLGSVAEAVVRLAPTPVLVVRPKAGHAEVPQIEPPCPLCLEVRRETGGRELWCERHREQRGRRHTYHHEDRNSSADESAPLLFPLR